jgi:peptide deformylase
MQIEPTRNRVISVVSILKIITFGHPTLRVRCEPVKEFNDDLRQLAADMHETMSANDGIGLAASQVNHRVRMLVVGAPIKDSEELLSMNIVNPEILDSRGEWEYEEGCLSIPDVRDVVTRVEWIKLKYQDLDGVEHLLEADGILGRVILHELDHLNGIMFTDHLSPIRRALHNGKLKRLIGDNGEEAA